MPEKKPFDIRERTFLFAVTVLKWVRTLPKDWGTEVAARQLLRAATSVGANVEEADGADTDKDKVYKWALSRKKAREARYWIRVIAANTTVSTESRALEQESTELINILSAMINNYKEELLILCPRKARCAVKPRRTGHTPNSQIPKKK